MPNFPPFLGPTVGPNSYKTLEFGPGDIAPLLSSVQRSGGPWAKGGRGATLKKYLTKSKHLCDGKRALLLLVTTISHIINVYVTVQYVSC